jgi:hypothetical protein
MTAQELAMLLRDDYKSSNIYFVVGFKKADLERYDYFLERVFSNEDQANDYKDGYDDNAVSGLEVWWKDEDQILSYGDRII